LVNAPPQATVKLESQRNIWIASTRPDQRPHLVPVWFAWQAGKIYLCIEPGSLKARNIAQQPEVALALEDGAHPVICEGRASVIAPPWPAGVLAIFKHKYDWDISTETQYTTLLEITPRKWLVW
jgi:F420H(2)-dependent biliverdin reductase